MGLFAKAKPAPPPEKQRKSAWKSHHHPRKIKIHRPYAKADGTALALVPVSKCADMKCKVTSKRIYIVNGEKHYAVYTSPYKRHKNLKKRKYARKITDNGAEILAKDKAGHWRRVPAF